MPVTTSLPKVIWERATPWRAVRAALRRSLQAAHWRPVIAARAAGVCCLQLRFGRTIVTFLLS